MKPVLVRDRGKGGEGVIAFPRIWKTKEIWADTGINQEIFACFITIFHDIAGKL
jgi:hypothetical protein